MREDCEGSMAFQGENGERISERARMPLTEMGFVMGDLAMLYHF